MDKIINDFIKKGIAMIMYWLIQARSNRSIAPGDGVCDELEILGVND